MKLSSIVLNAASDSESMGVSDEPSLDCKQPKTVLPADMPIGMLYVPYQTWQKIYDPQIGLARGTVFEELDKPFIGERTV